MSKYNKALGDYFDAGPKRSIGQLFSAMDEIDAKEREERRKAHPIKVEDPFWGEDENKK